MTDIATLTRAEAETLANCEQIIERGLKTFVEVGTALATIHGARLYRVSHESFEAYAKGRFNLSRPRAYELITAAAVVSGMPDTAAPITSARQATELARVAEPERAEVWRETVERTDGKPTASAVREVSAEHQKRADEQRDARNLLRRIVDLLVPVNRPVNFVEVWVKQLGPYDEELADLVGRATEAISALDEAIEGAGQ